MSGTNPVGTWALPLSTGPSVQDPTTYKGNIDGDIAVAQRVADAFAPRPASPAAMSIVVDVGFIASESPSGLQSIVEVAQQSVTLAAAPGAPNSRIDLVVIDGVSGIASVITGAPGNPPSPPALTPGKRQVAQIAVPSGALAIIASNITDLRAVWGSASSGRGIPWAIAGGSADAITASYVPATPNPVPDGYILGFRASAANATATPSFNPDGVGAQTITKKGGGGLLAGDIPGNLSECLLRYNLANTRWELLNPAVSVPTIGNAQILANTSGSTAVPVGTGLSVLLDAALGSTRGSIIARGAVGWGLIGPGLSGQVPTSNGTDIAMATPTVAAGSVNQAALKTTTGSVSAFSGNLVLPGGNYGFYPQVAAGNGGTMQSWIVSSAFGAVSQSYTTYIYIDNLGSGTTPPSAQQLYVQASPPYDLGDGEIHGFIYILVEQGSGKVCGVYSAEEPPWIYNGPTRIVPHRIDPMGRKFMAIKRKTITLDDVKYGRATLAEFYRSPIKEDEIQITQAIYHADMPLIPHPFASLDASRQIAVLLDPMHELIRHLLGEQQAGADIHSLIYDGHIRFDNVALRRSALPGVMQVALRI